MLVFCTQEFTPVLMSSFTETSNNVEPLPMNAVRSVGGLLKTAVNGLKLGSDEESVLLKHCDGCPPIEQLAIALPRPENSASELGPVMVNVAFVCAEALPPSPFEKLPVTVASTVDVPGVNENVTPVSVPRAASN